MRREDFQPWHCIRIARESRDLTSSEKLTYLMLASRADNGTLKCWPSYDTLAEDTGLSRKTVGRALAALEEKGYIFRSSGKGRRKVNVYTLAWTAGLRSKAASAGAEPQPGTPLAPAPEPELPDPPEPLPTPEELQTPGQQAEATAEAVDLQALTLDELKALTLNSPAGSPLYEAVKQERMNRMSKRAEAA